MKREAAAPSAAWRTLALSVLFLWTGVLLAMPGALLPQLERLWGLQDGRSGLLFFLFFVGTTVGAFCAKGALGRMLLVAVFATALPVALLARFRGLAVAAAMLLFGFGLGVAMTSISLLRSRQSAGRRAAELTRLNLLWAVGACSAPSLLLQSTAVFGLNAVLGCCAGAFAMCGAVAVAAAWYTPAAAAQTRWHDWRGWKSVPLRYVVTLPMATGIEAGVGAWLTTYAVRRGAAPLGVLSAGSAMWAGLLLSRLLFSQTRFQAGQSDKAASLLGGLLVGGLLLMVMSAAAAPIALGAFCTGFAIGPIYPYLLAMLLSRGEAGNAGFLLAGVGSSALPLLIGQVSQHSHSLRMGLWVPLLGALVLLATLVRTPNPDSAGSAG